MLMVVPAARFMTAHVMLSCRSTVDKTLKQLVTLTAGLLPTSQACC